MFSAFQLNYYAIAYLATSIGGNKFINCTISGVAEILGCIITGLALSRMSDRVFFAISCLITCVANFVFYVVPAGLPQYLCFTLFAMGVAGQYASIYILAELRLPPEYTATGMMLMTTLGTCAAAFSPSIGSADQPVMMIVPGLLAALNLLMTFFIGPPGKYLPK